MYMLVMIGDKNYLRTYDREDMETFLDEDSAVAVFPDLDYAENWLETNDIEYEIVGA